MVTMVGTAAVPCSAMRAAVCSSNSTLGVRAQPRAVLDGVHAGLSRGPDAGRAEGVRGDRDTRASSFVDGGLNLGHAELGHTHVRARRHSSTGRHDLQARGARLELASGRGADPGLVVRFETQKVAVAAGDRDRRAGGQDPRTRRSARL